MSLATIFLTGLLSGGLTCLAVQGGLLAAAIAQEKEIEKNTKDALTIFYFLFAKLVAYTILGFLLGAFGSIFQLSLTTKLVLQFLVAIFMIGTALSILEAHPIFRYFIIKPPKFLLRIVKNQSRSKQIFTPMILGVMTIFIPCGTTQAMMALSVGSTDPISGAIILFVFILGTSPLFFTLFYFATRLGELARKRFMKIAATAIILLALYSINQALVISGNGLDIGSIWQTVRSEPGVSQNSSVSNIQIITITDQGYSPDIINVKKGSHVKLNLINNEAKGCIQQFVIPKLGIQQTVLTNTSAIVEFDAPNSPEQLIFTCSMGMYRGIINVE